MKRVYLIKVFIASPGDMEEERTLSEKIITDWNNEYTDDKKVVLMPIKWEQDSTSSYHPLKTGQTIINQQLLDNADILIAMFNKKLGTPINGYRSGTVSEIEEFYKEHKDHLGIFFKNIENTPFLINEAVEASRLLEFKEEISSKGLYREYNYFNIKQFLTAEVNKLVSKFNSDNVPSINKAKTIINFDSIWKDEESVPTNLNNIMQYLDENNKLIDSEFKTNSGKRYIYNFNTAQHPNENEFKNPKKIFLKNINKYVYLETNFSKAQGKIVGERLFNELS